jgi:hypothetical protein
VNSAYTQVNRSLTSAGGRMADIELQDDHVVEEFLQSFQRE